MQHISFDGDSQPLSPKPPEPADMPESPNPMFDGLLLDSSIAGAKPKERLTEEEKFALKIQRRREQDAGRRSRLQNAKNAISCDKDTLDQQVAFRRQKKEEERQFNISGDSGLLGANKAVVQAQKEANKKRAEQRIEMRDHNLEAGATKKAERTAEKQSRVHDAPARDGDSDPRCGAASLQQFAGEDLMKNERLRQQRMMQIDVIEQQKFEKAMLKRMQEEETKKFAAEVADIARMRNEMEESESQLRKEMLKSNLQEQMSMGALKADEKKRQKEDEHARNAAEMEFVKTDVLTAEVGAQYLDNGRVKRDAYKGAGLEEKLLVKEELLKQAAEKQAAKQMQRHADRQDKVEAHKVLGMLAGSERQQVRSKKALAAQCLAENLKMQEEAKLRKKEQNALFANEVSPDFYAQFGKDAR